MQSFNDDAGRAWVATACQEDTPRHHGRWYLAFHPDGEPQQLVPIPEVRWQTRATAERTLRTMSTFELRRRLRSALTRTEGGALPGDAARARSPAGAA